MTKEELQRVGRELKAMRTKRGLRQVDVANDPKAEISLGTLQAIEGAWYEVRDTNVDKYALFFGTTREKLLLADKPKPVTPNDPLLEGLNDEHLGVARAYMRARKRVRTCVEILLSTHPQEDHLTGLLLKLEQLPAERLVQVDAWLSTDPRAMELLERVREHLIDIENYPTYVALVEEGLRLLDQRKPITTDHQKSKPQKKSTAPTRRA